MTIRQGPWGQEGYWHPTNYPCANAWRGCRREVERKGGTCHPCHVQSRAALNRARKQADLDARNAQLAVEWERRERERRQRQLMAAQERAMFPAPPARGNEPARYTTWSPERGCCGHEHRDEWLALKCAERDYGAVSRVRRAGAAPIPASVYRRRVRVIAQGDLARPWDEGAGPGYAELFLLGDDGAPLPLPGCRFL